MNRTTLFLSAIFAGISLTDQWVAAEPPPNIVLIVSDDQGYGDLGCYGSQEIKTPHLDKLSAGGVRLTNFYVTWPACTPSRCSLLTGRYPQRNGTYDMFRNYLVDVGHKYTPAEYAVSPEMILGTDTREIFLSEVLKERGYATGCFGKWDLGQLRRYLPLQQGFDRYYGFTNTGIDYFTHERYGVPSMRDGNKITTRDKGEYATDLFHREAARFLRDNHRRPFFLYVAYNAPHSASNLDPEIRGSVQAPEKYLAMYPAGETRREKRRRGYLAAVTSMDDSIGRLLKMLDDYKIADRTIVVFLSDNGGGGAADNGPLRGGKGRMFEGGLRVPCLVRWPGKIRPGRVNGEFLTSLEIFPTLLRAVGAEPPKGVVLDGFDMLPVLAGKTKSSRREMYWQRRDHKAARVGDIKWIKTPAAEMLFDLSSDIGEENDLSHARPELLKKMREHFASWEQQMQAAEPRRPFRDF